MLIPCSRAKFQKRLLFALVCFTVVIASACQKESEITSDFGDSKRTVVDYVWQLEFYITKYRMQYNEHYQVTDIYRGDEFSTDAQMKRIARLYYADHTSDLPDSVVTYDLNGFRVGIISPSAFNTVAEVDTTTEYHIPQRQNKLLTTPGGAVAFALAGSPVLWGDEGTHSGPQVFLLNDTRYLNRTALQDTIKVSAPDGLYNGFHVYLFTFDQMGYPTEVRRMWPYDTSINGILRARISYREE